MIASLTDRHQSQVIRSLEGDHFATERGGLRPVPDALAPPPALHLVAPEGQLQVHTAPYRGSYSSVLSQAVRAAGLGSRVLISQFLKGGVQQGPSGRVQLCGGLVWLRPDVPACVSEPNLEGCRDAVQAV